MARSDSPASQQPFDNLLVHPELDRASQRRDDDAWAEDQWRSLHRRAIVLAGDLGWTPGGQAGWLDDSGLRDIEPELVTKWFLGLLDGAPYFAVLLEQGETLDADETHWQGLRGIASTLPAEDAALFAHGLALAHWYRLHRYCGGCGEALVVSAAGHAHRCRNHACDNDTVFPRVDPAVIVTVSRGEEVLLGRQPHWPEGMYSCVAGFLEAGESLEQAVRREVMEEVGVKVHAIRYASSQPWPFPQSLMVGFHCTTREQDITLHDDELEDARWFTREQIDQGIEDGSLVLPSAISISRRLLEEWRDGLAKAE
ncbi:MAG: NAD(+) diphosphatase [Gammaproteobacteria bacterium]|nr:NAD(+) diphosphatase [Gammaproteobacteria bacterium]